MMGLTDYNLTPKAKKSIKDAKSFAEANNHSLINNCHLAYGCLANVSDSLSLKFKTKNINLDKKAFVKFFKDFSSQNQKLFEGVKGSGPWHDEVNEAISSLKNFQTILIAIL